MKNPTLSVIIPCHARHIPKLESLLKELLPVFEHSVDFFEVVVVVNGLNSTDVSIPAFPSVSKARVKLIEVPMVITPAQARNLGVSSTYGEYLLFLDSDVKIENFSQKFIKEKIDFLRNSKFVASYLPKIRKPSSFETIWQKGEYFEDLRSTRTYVDNQNEAKVLIGAFLLVSREIYSSVLGFNDFSLASEDREFSAKLLNSGYKIRYDDSLVIFHKYPSSLRNILRRKRWHAEGNASLYYLYPNIYNRSFSKWVLVNIKMIFRALSRSRFDLILYRLIVIPYYTFWFYYFLNKYRYLKYEDVDFRRAALLKKYNFSYKDLW
ncbi:glycosyltransferase [bacterium]|nr:glycosyltransferase [bacterium]